MDYSLTRGLINAKRSVELARDSHAHWIRLLDQTLVWGQAEIMTTFSSQLGRAAVAVESMEAPKSGSELYLVTQIGREFETAYPNATIVINKGRYLVVELLVDDADALRQQKPLYWQVQPLPVDTVVLDERDRAARAAIEWVSGLVGTVSESNYSGYLSQFAEFFTRHSLRPEFDNAAALAHDRLQSLGYTAQLQTITVGTDNSVNVIADLPGQLSGSRDLVIVTAHLDSINTSGGVSAPAPGADDNASGSAAVLELARVLANHAAKHDLRLILFGGEEQGLHGSNQYVASLASAERSRIRAVINMDMIATLNTASPNVLLESTADFTSLVDQLSDAASTYTGLTVQTSFSPFGSDHVPFLNAGLPALLTIEGADGSNSHVHTANDTLEHINYELALEILRMNVAATALMLDRVQSATWATCTVNRAGPAENGTIYIHLSDNDARFNSWFQAYPGMKKEMLATALAAMNANATINVHLTGTEAYSQINRLYVSANTSTSTSTYINSAISLLLLEDTMGTPYTEYLLTL